MGVTTFMAFEMRESRPGSVLRQKVAYIKALTQYDDLSEEGKAAVPSLREFARDSLSLPLRLFFTEPIVCLTSIMGATVVSCKGPSRQGGSADKMRIDQPPVSFRPSTSNRLRRFLWPLGEDWQSCLPNHWCRRPLHLLASLLRYSYCQQASASTSSD